LGMHDDLPPDTDTDWLSILIWLCLSLCQMTIGGLCQILYTSILFYYSIVILVLLTIA
jgi:hypothetical protein